MLKSFTDQNGNSMLHKAVKDNNLSLVYKSALSEPAIINQQNLDGYSALHYAVKRGNNQMIEAVLQCGVDPLLKTKLSQTARDIAQANKRSDIVDLLDLYSPGLCQSILSRDQTRTIDLLKKWVNLANIVKSGNHSMAFSENLNSMCLDYYLHQNQFIHLIAADLYNEISIFAGENDAQTGIYVNCTHLLSHRTPLALAILNHNCQMVELLLELGADPRIRLQNGIPLTHLAWEVKAPFTILLPILKSSPFSWHMRSPDDGLTILFRLVLSESITPVHIQKILTITECMALKDRNNENLDFYEFCKLKNRHDLIDCMWEVILEMMQTKNGKLKLVELAVSLGDSQILLPPSFVLERSYPESQLKSISKVVENFTENVKSLQNKSDELFDAVNIGDLSAVKIHNVADFVDRTGRTALHQAILRDKYEIVQWLLTERPALLTISDTSDRYPLHYAYGVQESFGKKYIHLFMDMTAEANYEQLTDVNNTVPSRCKIDKSEMETNMEN